ncbi:MAG: DsbA family protein [Campylobacterota bacterium]|nr:DsbA family protein [Campylobacterota bacterium]
MSLMLKLLSILILSTSILNADALEESALKFEKNRLAQNPQITIKSVDIAIKKPVGNDGWYGIVFDIVADLQGKTVKAKDTVFTNGSMATPDLFNIKNGQSYKDTLKPTLTQNYYSDEHLIAGNKDAKHKIVIFSDPLCPFCIEYVSEVIRDVKKNPSLYALYYYHFPLLSLHPDANVITKAMHVANSMGMKDVTLRTYEGAFHNYLKEHKNSDDKVLEAFNKVMNSNITLAQINKADVLEHIAKDVFLGEEVMVQGTPTVFFDGQYDKSRYKYDRVKK